jgi:thiol-disulfide isomerase/thioredoxin
LLAIAAAALLAAPESRAADVEPVVMPTLPSARGGQDLVGTRFPKLDFDRWIRRDERAGSGREPARATLYRWWTDTCPYCRASLPAVEMLRRDYADKGLRIVGVYHPKPPRDVDDKDVIATARRFGYGGPIALDEGWSALDTAYLSTGPRRATSVSMLVDREGVIRFVHPGPVFFPSDDPQHAIQNDDYQRLKQAIDVLLGEGLPAKAQEETRSTP